MGKTLTQIRATRQFFFKRLSEIYVCSQEAISDSSKRNEFRARYEGIEELKTQFEINHHSIIGSGQMTDELLDAEDSLRQEFDDKYFAAKSVFMDLFPVNVQSPAPLNQTSFNVTSNPKVYEVDIPIFRGDYKDWPTFIDLYDSLIHNDVNLPTIQKFGFLVKHCEGEPLNLLKTLRMTEANYLVAYQALKDRYQNKRLMATEFWNNIYNAPKMSSDDHIILRRLVDTFKENLAALKILGFPTSQWDFILLNLLLSKIDFSSARSFELAHTNFEVPSYEDLVKFLEKHCKALSSFAYSNHESELPKPKPVKSQNDKFSKPKLNAKGFLSQDAPNKCALGCLDKHLIIKCPIFNSRSPHERYALAKQSRLCILCLSSFHVTRKCTSNINCQLCQSRHHTLLHWSSDSPQKVNSSVNSQPQTSSRSPDIQAPIELAQTSTSTADSSNRNKALLSFNFSSVEVNESTLLATALVQIADRNGNLHTCRALLDSASQVNCITEKCFRRLGLKSYGSGVEIQGLGDTSVARSKGYTTFELNMPGFDKPFLAVYSAILPRICVNMPTSSVEHKQWDYLAHLKLADPGFKKPSGIDILLGASVFPLLLLNGKIMQSLHEPIALNTIYGWIVMGNVTSDTSNYNFQTKCSFLTTLESLDKTLSKFWQLEEVPHVEPLSEDDKLCEKSFVSTHYRDKSSGRFVVTLPFKRDEPLFSSSRDIALKQFYSLERRLLKDPCLREKYSAVIQEYLDSSHMEMVSPPERTSDLQKMYYLPHHSVVKASDNSVRVVFNASCPTPQGSLNDHLLTGPKLQKDIVAILLNFRKFPLVFCCDIKAMYRMLVVDSHHRDYQRLLWRSSPDSPVLDYRLTRVTFGVASSPFLALRAILQLAREGADTHPNASKVLQSQIFVDDICTGVSSLEEALNLKSELIDLLSSAGFELRKWSSNNPQFLKTISSDIRQTSVSLDTDSDCIHKVLGLQWDPIKDEFTYKVSQINDVCTKRSILSAIARTYDPLGLISPLIFFAKYLMQILWTQGIDWDDVPSQDIIDQWTAYKNQLSLISQIKIPRFILIPNIVSLQLHVFGDASEMGFGACAYFRVTDSSGHIYSRLVIAKTKIAPLKKVSLPRLELSAAVLVADLVLFIKNNYIDLEFESVFGWSDSMVVIGWIKAPPYKWRTYVANRVSHVQDIVPPASWYHVPSQSNPADIASRGLMPAELIESSMWWNGPDWLCLPADHWPKPISVPKNLPELLKEERKTVLTSVATKRVAPFLDLLEKFSSLQKILHIVTYALNFINMHIRKQQVDVSIMTENDLHTSLLFLIRLVQKECFKEELDLISKGLICSKPIRKLCPFIDTEGVLRVGGRLVTSLLPYEQKHPALLPSNHKLTDLIICHYHKKYLHPGLQTLSYLLLQHFWIIASKRVIRRNLSKCYRCFRANPKPYIPKMGNLPSYRISQLKPFQCVGVDMAGPFTITMAKLRGAKTLKAYLCLFICCSIRAVHLELVSDLSADAFLAALRRLIARRGKISALHSDCGTNFIAASKYICDIVSDAAKEEQISWSFNAPSSPHFGGLWEAGVKSAKKHLVRVIGDRILTYEELNTVFIQIEAILNSRPICSVSSDPNDISCLTPGHFLNLAPMSALPDKDLTSLKVTRLDRWQLLLQIQQHFWGRWHNEYLTSLNQRNKWCENRPNLDVGTLVVLKEDNTPVLSWRLARIINVYPGPDGIVRVVQIRTANGIFKRPVVKLCPLPSQE